MAPISEREAAQIAQVVAWSFPTVTVLGRNGWRVCACLGLERDVDGWVMLRLATTGD